MILTVFCPDASRRESRMSGFFGINSIDDKSNKKVQLIKVTLLRVV